jgi:hypothetical protein
MPRSRRRRRAAPGVALIVAAALLAGGCGGGAKHSDEPPGGPTRGSRAADRTTEGVIPLRAGKVTVESVGAAHDLPRSVIRTLLGQVQAYVDGATVTPLLNGRPDRRLQDQFLFTVAPRVAPSGPDRAALTDDSLGRVQTRLEATAKPVRFTALDDGAGHWLMVAATFDYTVKSTLRGERLLVKRYGDLYFSRSPKGKWFVNAYKVGVARELGSSKQKHHASAGKATTTTAPNKRNGR